MSSDGPAPARRNVLVVTARAEALRGLVKALTASGYEVRVVTELTETVSPDLALVDVRDEVHWATAELLSAGRLIAVVGSPEDMRRAFGLGAEDCVLGRPHPDEVVARCDAVLRRTARRPAPSGAAPAIYVDRRLWVNFNARQVWVAGRPAHLTPREFRLLQFLIRHRDRTVGHDEILGTVWSRPGDSERPTEVLKQYIWRLRQKIEDDPNAPTTIVTTAGEGYRFAAHLD